MIGTMVVRKRQRDVVAVEPAQDDYGFRLVIRQGKRWGKLTPEERRDVLMARASVLEEYARQCREGAELVEYGEVA